MENQNDDIISPLKFLKFNKDIIKMSSKEFKEFLMLSNLAVCGTGSFIATSYALENGYMINDMHTFIKKYSASNCHYLYIPEIYLRIDAKLTKKGQAFILNKFN